MKTVNKYSNFTGDDLIDAEARLNEAKAVYDEWYPNIIRWQAEKEGWASRTGKFDAWNRIVKAKEDAQKDYDFIVKALGEEQGISLVDKIQDERFDPDRNSFPWTNVGMAVGAVIIIVIIYKII
ncbi:hypothetical protein ACUNWD_03840 [Sunxiuqinia sp. A32]|uniref:hypothetical protein n=1 Tax=Sunxiuqinia sp. A32 TaxID=3461496 RepID=UPI00404647B7